MVEWKECKLGDIVTFQRGFDITKKEQVPGAYPVVSSSGIKSYHTMYKVKSPGVVVGRKGTLGTVFYLNTDFWPHDTTLWVRNFHGNYPLFVFYFLKEFHFEQYDVGSSNPTLNRNHIHLLPSTIPPLPEQKAIASVLSSLDDKIDLLNRQNKTLEAIAETLFRQWFVPARAGEPHAGGEEAQEDWEEKRLGDILISIESGSRPKGGIDPDLKHGIPSIGAENINGLGNYNYGSTKYITSEYFEKMKRGIVQDYDVLIYKDGAYIGKKSMFAKGFPFKKCAINEHVFILRTESIFLQLFLYFALEQEELALLNANSAQPGLNQTSMKSFELLLPKSELIEMFGQTIMPLIDKIFFNGNQIRILEKLRDTLLPKLMSGEVRVEYKN